MNKPEPMSDERIEQALDEVFAGWLMDEADEMCQAKAIRHLARAIEAERDAQWTARLEEAERDAKRWRWWRRNFAAQRRWTL